MASRNLWIQPLEPRRLLSAIPTSYPTGPGPASVSVGADGQIVYSYEPNGDQIPDFSECGYGGGGIAIPEVPVKTTLSPVTADNAPQIQAAIDALGNQPLDGNGFRGAILLRPGVYPIGSTIQINKSGIVLRGSGSGTNGTILRLTFSGEAIHVSGSGSRSKVSGTTHNVTNTYVPLGANWFTLDSVAGLHVGDSIIIHRPDTLEWRTATGQLDHFQQGDADLDWDRVITAIDGNRIMFDAPITESLDQQWGGGTVYRYTWSGRISNCGVEDLRADCTQNPDDLNNTDGSFMTLNATANCWVRRCYNDRMKGHTMLINSSKWDTVEDITSYHNPLPGSHSGASTQIFAGSFSELILWHRLTAYSGGFEFSGGRQNAGPMAWVECQVPTGFAFSGPHLQWNMGYLWDSLDMAHNLTCIEQHGGEAGGNHVVWNCESTATYNFETVPTVHQYLIGDIGDPLPSPSQNGPPDRILSYGTHVEPGSLYRAQLYQRVGSLTGLLALGKPDGSNWFDLAGVSSLSMSQGSACSTPITFTPAVAYGGQPVTLTCTGLPTGVTAHFSSSSLSSAGLTSLNLTTRSGTPAGQYVLNITGTGTFPLYSGGMQTVKRSCFIRIDISSSTGTITPAPIITRTPTRPTSLLQPNSAAELLQAAVSIRKNRDFFSDDLI